MQKILRASIVLIIAKIIILAKRAPSNTANSVNNS
jgi:hypothetical protein